MLLKFKLFVNNKKGEEERISRFLKVSLSFLSKCKFLKRKKVLNILRKKNNHHRYLLSRIINCHRDNPLRSKLSIVHRLNRGANGSNLDKNQLLSRESRGGEVLEEVPSYLAGLIIIIGESVSLERSVTRYCLGRVINNRFYRSRSVSEWFQVYFFIGELSEKLVNFIQTRSVFFLNNYRLELK